MNLVSQDSRYNVVKYFFKIIQNQIFLLRTYNKKYFKSERKLFSQPANKWRHGESLKIC